MTRRVTGVLFILLSVVSCHKDPQQMSQTQEGRKPIGMATCDGSHQAESYRRLLEQYQHLASSAEHFQEKMALRRRLSSVCSDITQQHLPLGVRREVVVDWLGPPTIDMESAMLYYGDRQGFFHCFVFKDGTLVKVDHVRTFDLE